jgi:hypothetical protein
MHYAREISILDMILDFTENYVAARLGEDRSAAPLVEWDGRYYVAGRYITAPIVSSVEALEADAAPTKTSSTSKTKASSSRSHNIQLGGRSWFRCSAAPIVPSDILPQCSQ